MNKEEFLQLANTLLPSLDDFVAQLRQVDSNGYTALMADYGKYQLSDINVKHIRDTLSRGNPLSDDDVALIMHMAGEDENGNSYETIVAGGEDTDDSILDSYAEHLRNYLYNYKEEATELDPRIDPNEDEIGIMAQDLEKVNPACVSEIKGTKTVDTNKLSLMNAGAIGDVARELQDIKQRLLALEEKND